MILATVMVSLLSELYVHYNVTFCVRCVVCANIADIEMSYLLDSIVRITNSQRTSLR